MPDAPRSPLFWPWLAAVSAGEAAADIAAAFARSAAELTQAPPPPAPQWTTPPHCVALELPTMRLRNFSSGNDGRPLVVCAPFALHGATIADLAPGHSLMAVLRQAGHHRLFLTDWRSATAEMRFFSIDTYLADLNVAVDDLGEPVDMVGLCQGGWLALLYAARFPDKVRRLAMAGAPIDIRAASSGLSNLTDTLPLSTFVEFVRLGEGRVLGRRMLELWGTPAPEPQAIRDILQVRPGTRGLPALEERFRVWNAWTFDLPGTYYLQVVDWLFKENRLAEGRFVALGRRIDLSKLTVPLYLLAGRDDDLVAPDQLFSLGRRVGTPASLIEREAVPGGHLALFMGAETLRKAWPKIGRWLKQPA